MEKSAQIWVGVQKAWGNTHLSVSNGARREHSRKVEPSSCGNPDQERAGKRLIAASPLFVVSLGCACIQQYAATL